MTIAAPPRPPTTPPPEDLAALMEAARRRQRRRRRRLAFVVVTLVGAALGAYYGISATKNEQPPAAAPPSRVPMPTALRFHLRGFGTPLPTTLDSGACPQGRTLITIYSDAGVRIGTAQLCVQTISKLDLPQWGVRRIVQTVREVDSLPAGTILSRQQQTFLFARDQRHTRAIFEGHVIGGSGLFAHHRGTVSGGGTGLDGKADWLVTLRLS